MEAIEALHMRPAKDRMIATSSKTIDKSEKAKHVLIVADSCYSGKLARGAYIS
jgi:hypothetical protein